MSRFRRHRCFLCIRQGRTVHWSQYSMRRDWEKKSIARRAGIEARISLEINPELPISRTPYLLLNRDVYYGYKVHRYIKIERSTSLGR